MSRWRRGLAAGVVLFAILGPGSATAGAAEDDRPLPADSPAADPNAPPAIGASVAGTLDRGMIERLPLVGRRYSDLLTLMAGVTDIDGNGIPDAFGAREAGLQYRLDGVDITDPLGSGAGLFIDPDAIRALSLNGTDPDGRYGRFDGGVAGIGLRSGDDRMQGSLKSFYRGTVLDGDGSAEPSDTFYGVTIPPRRFRETTSSLAVGGPVLRGRLWYFVDLTRIQRDDSQEFLGATISRPEAGWNSLVKLSAQIDPRQHLSLTYAVSPRDFGGEFDAFNVDPDSGGDVSLHARELQAGWRWTPAPGFISEAAVGWLDSGIAVEPVSDLFHQVHVPTITGMSNGRPFVLALYPQRECSVGGNPNKPIPNCDPSLGPISISYVDLVSGFTTGPLDFRSSDSRTRASFRDEVTFVPSGGKSPHEIVAGFELQGEDYKDDRIDNPVLFNATFPCPSCRDPFGQPIPNAVTGSQFLYVPTPASPEVHPSALLGAVWAGDAWRVARGVVVQVSLRADSSRLKSEGFTPVAPRRERRRSIALVETLCDEGFRIEASGGASNASFVCGTRLNSNFEPSANLIFTFDANTPARLGKYDLDHDGTFNEGRDGSPWRKELSTVIGRRPESFSIRNVDLSPRFAVGWDPWSGAPSQAGKTRVFATWGRYYDRLPLLPIAAETTPYVNAYTFTSDPQTHRIDPNAVSSSTSTPSIETVARDLETPRTDILTAGFTRELSVTWVAGITWTRKRAARLLQDADRNHLACRQFGRSLGVDPNLLCPLVTDVDGNIVRLNDQFGSPNQFPNGLVDLYVANPSFDRILRVGNFNDASFDATTLAITKRLLAGWQLQASYTFSRSRGEGEDFTSLSRDDPALSGLEHAPLAWDQRHVVVLAATGALARDVDAGMSLRWESGTPYSVEAFAPDLDNLGNPSARAFFPTGARNDQRNGGAWSLDGRLAKRFRIGRIQVGAEIAVRNLMNQEATAIAAYVPSNVGGAQLVGTGASPRRPGRSWQLGAGVYF